MDPYRSAAPEPAPPARTVPARVRAQLLLGGTVREIGLGMVAGALSVIAYVSPTFDAEPDYAGVFFATVLGALGAGFVLGSIPAARRELRLLRTGAITTGLLADAAGSRRSFQFEVASGAEHICHVRVRGLPSPVAVTTIVYDARWPDRAIAPAFLPGAPEIDGGAVRLRTPNPLGALTALVALGLLILDTVLVL